MCSRRPSTDSSDPATDAEGRLALYRRAARALNAFFAHWTAPFCVHCLAVTALHHRDDPRADVELLTGVFPGCCHAGVADALWVPGTGEEGRFPPELGRAVAREREAVARGGEPLRYGVRERRTGVEAAGVACAQLAPDGCRLGDLKAPLCLCYACEPIREALAGVLEAGGCGAAGELLGDGADDFVGARAVLRAVVCGPRREAGTAVEALEGRLEALDRALEAQGLSGGGLLDRWRQARPGPPAGPPGRRRSEGRRHERRSDV
ncbi:MAG: hypothetical protein ACNA8S_13495 [Deferrisomatales bacterium]